MKDTEVDGQQAQHEPDETDPDDERHVHPGDSNRDSPLPHQV